MGESDDKQQPQGQQHKRVGMNKAAFGACELGRQLRRKKVAERRIVREMSASKAALRIGSFSRMQSQFGKARPLFMEMLKTERLYVDALHVVVSRFMLPLQVALEAYPGGILSKKEISTIFGNVAQLFEVNMELLRIIESNLGCSCDGPCCSCGSGGGAAEDLDLASAFAAAFTNMLPVFKAFYSVYCNSYEGSVDALEECRANNPLFRRFLDAATRHACCAGLDLGDLLIKPVQRICKYPLFFRGLLECTAANHPMHATIAAAATAVSRIADQVNATGREAENAMKSFEIANQLEGLDKVHPDLQVVAPGRRFVQQFQCKLHYSFQAPGAKPTREMRHAPAKKKPRDCFLFNDALLVAKGVGDKLEFRFWLPLHSVLVTIPPSQNSGTTGLPASASGAAADARVQGESNNEEDGGGGSGMFSAAQKRMPLDIVRIRMIRSDKPAKKTRGAARVDRRHSGEGPTASATTATAAPTPAAADEGSFSSSSDRSIGCSESKVTSTPTKAAPPAPKPVLEMPVVEKYTLWFKSAMERTRVYQRIEALQAELEQNKQQRETCLNQSKHKEATECTRVPLHAGPRPAEAKGATSAGGLGGIPATGSERSTASASEGLALPAVAALGAQTA